jgi:two-component system, OmpR family, alkaline phosphatase synthesis response regulator PhoP
VIPICDASPPSANESSLRFTILCIEDDPAISKLYALRLPACGARVICSANGRDGYSTAIESNPDLILLDNDLPDGKGLDLLPRLRSHTSLADVPIVMLTGFDPRTVQRRSLALGVLDVLRKPVNFESLLQQIKQLASMPREGRFEWPSPDASPLLT